MKENEQVVKEQFKKQAIGFSNQALTMNNSSYLKWMLQNLDLSKSLDVLDVAAGTGILSRAIAPSVRKVTSIDLSEDMIREGIRLNKASGITNIKYVKGNVEKLPFSDNTFDLVTSRFAFHHFKEPHNILKEMIRVSKQTFLIIDMISPEDDKLCNQYNHYEKLRDPSHTKALKQSEYEKQLHDLGVAIKINDTKVVPVNVDRWLQLTHTDKETADHIILNLKEEIQTKKQLTGFFPFVQNNELMFQQKWIKIIGLKES